MSGHAPTNPWEGLGLATPHAECRAEEPGLPMPGIETIQIIYCLQLFSSMMHKMFAQV